MHLLWPKVASRATKWCLPKVFISLYFCYKFRFSTVTDKLCNNHYALFCDSCDKWVHIKCNFLNKKTYQKLQKDKSPWFCIDCVKNQLPFQSQVNTDPNQKYVLPHKHSTLKKLLEHLDLDEDRPTSKYFTPSEFSQLDLKNSNFFI